MRVAIYAEPHSLDPHIQDEFLTFMVLLNIYEGLVGFDEALSIEPALALSWENPDDLTWRFHLQPDARFHDGRPVRAQDVAFSIDRAKSHPRSNVATYLVAIEQVRVVDDLTLELTTSRAYPILLNKLTHVLILPDGTPDEIGDPIGSGPYRVHEQGSGGRLELRVFTEHRDFQDQEAEVSLIPVIDADERAEMLIAGEIDVALELPVSQLVPIASAPGAYVVAHDSLAVDYLQFRIDRPPFDDLRVRQAVHLALDRQALVKEMLGGQGAPASQMVARSVFGFSPTLRESTQNLEKARQLMADAGYEGGVQVELEFRLSKLVEPIRQQLAEIGIRIEPMPQPWEELFPRLQAGDVDFYYGGFVATSGDASDVFDSKIHGRDAEQGYGDTNFNDYRNTELDALIESSGTILEIKTRQRVLQECMQLLMEDLPLIPLFVPRFLTGFGTGIEWVPRADGRMLAAGLRRSRGKSR